MAKFETLEVRGFRPAIDGMRNPLKSWDKNDSGYCLDSMPCHSCKITRDYCKIFIDKKYFILGPNDYKLAKSLCKAGPEHRKWMRQVIVWVNITAPRFFWSEFDTYKVGTSANSESTMHTLLKEDFDYSQFEWPPFQGGDWDIEASYKDYIDILKIVRDRANNCNGEEKEHYHQILKAMLPESFLQMRTVCLNYEVLSNMYRQRKNHRLPQWSIDFVSWVKTLPYSEFITQEWPNEKIDND